MQKIFAFTILVLSTIPMIFGQKNSDISFRTASNYFVLNSFKRTDLKSNKILSAKKFKEIFGMARYMGTEGKPTPIDFTKQFVIAAIHDITDVHTSLIPKKLEKVNKNKLKFSYETKIGAKQTSTMQPFTIIIVNRKYKNFKIDLATRPLQNYSNIK